MSARVLCVALAGHGHITPTLPAVTELARRGHHVEYACGPELAAEVTAAGATWVPLPAMAPFVPPPQVGPETVALWFRHFFGALAATYPVLREHVGARRPDVIVYDATNWPARLVARAAGLPAVRTVPNLATNEHYRGIGDALGAGLDELPETAAFATDVAAFAARHDVELDVAATFDVVEELNLVFVPRAFQPAGDTFDDRFLFLGPMIGRRAGGEPWSPSRPELPLVHLSLGSIFTDHPELYRHARDAFDDGAYEVTMAVGDLDPAALGPLPVTMHARAWFPQLEVLRAASAFITHAGMGSTMEALSFGVPMLALPQMPEQVVNADRITELGIGRRLDAGTLTADALRGAVDRVRADADLAARLAHLRDEAHRGGGAPRAADAIEAHLG